MAEYILFKNLFIPQKDLPSFNQQSFRADMQAIETWGNNIQATYDIIIGTIIPKNVQATMQIITVNIAASGGFAEYNFITSYKYGYTALVSSGDATAADSMALSTLSTLDTLEVYATLGGAPVTASVVVIALLIGA